MVVFIVDVMAGCVLSSVVFMVSSQNRSDML